MQNLLLGPKNINNLINLLTEKSI